MPFIDWINEEDATGDVAEVYNAWKAANPQRDRVPEILKCFSLRPDFLKAVVDFSYELHFQDGHLTRRIKEMIATFVSALNQCPY
ncbi:MAG: carboxymuconolactone decarboxylase family protein [Planctomycetes bacterium]|nr:carboxymuconolactone decarboxylase family protein [Planctomycetota bacterium]